jgi:hypothetical protein
MKDSKFKIQNAKFETDFTKVESPGCLWVESGIHISCTIDAQAAKEFPI